MSRDRFIHNSTPPTRLSVYEPAGILYVSVCIFLVLISVQGCGTNFTGRYRFTCSQLEERDYQGGLPSEGGIPTEMDTQAIPESIVVESLPHSDTIIVTEYLDSLSPVPAPEIQNEIEDGGDSLCPLSFPSPVIDRNTYQRAAEILSGLLHFAVDVIRTNPYISAIITFLVRGLDEYFPDLCDEIMAWMEDGAQGHHYHERLQRVPCLYPGAPLWTVSHVTTYRQVAAPVIVFDDICESGSHLKGYEIVY